jgi:hypothetical protein
MMDSADEDEDYNDGGLMEGASDFDESDEDDTAGQHKASQGKKGMPSRPGKPVHGSHGKSGLHGSGKGKAHGGGGKCRPPVHGKHKAQRRQRK